MKKLLLTLLACTCALVSAYAQTSTTPSDESLKELLQLSGSQKLVSDMQQQMKGMFCQLDEAGFGEPGHVSEQTAMITKMQDKMSTLLAEEMSWSRMEAVYIGVYKESFTQDEINQLIAFYKSPHRPDVRPKNADCDAEVDACDAAADGPPHGKDQGDPDGGL